MIAIATLCATACLHTHPGHAVHPLTYATVEGKKYFNCKVLKVDPIGVTFKHDNGIAKVRFKEMPDHYRKRYHYNPKVEKEFTIKNTVPSKQALVRHYHLKKLAVERFERAPYGLVRDKTTGLIGIASNPATKFYQSPYSNVSIADQLYQNHFSKHAQRTYGGARIGSNILGPRLYPWIRNARPRQLGTFGAGPSGGSLAPSGRSGFSPGGPIAPSLGAGPRR